MYALILKKSAAGSVPVRGIESYRGENRTAFKSRAAALAGADETVTDVYSRFTGISNGVWAGMWKHAVAEGLDTSAALDLFALDSTVVPAWRSGINAYYKANPKKSPPDRLPEDTDSTTDTDSGIAT